MHTGEHIVFTLDNRPYDTNDNGLLRAENVCIIPPAMHGGIDDHTD